MAGKEAVAGRVGGFAEVARNGWTRAADRVNLPVPGWFRAGQAAGALSRFGTAGVAGWNETGWTERQNGTGTGK